MHAVAAPHAARRPETRGSRLAVGASLSGVELAPGPSLLARAPSHEAWGLRPKVEARARLSLVMGGLVVGLCAMLALGLLMRLAHQAEGWPVARFVVSPGKTVELAVHSVLGLLAFLLGATYARRGARHWRGDLPGGQPNAVVNALLAALAFFCAIELLSAVT